MKKIIGIILIFFFVGSFAGSYLWIRHQRHRIRREIKNTLAQINKDELTILSFNAEEVERLDWQNPHEFLHQGKMYDVVEKIETEKGIIFSCWLDKEETKLNNQLNQLLTSFMATNKPIKNTKNNLFSFFKKLYNSPMQLIDWSNTVLKRTTFLPHTINYSSISFSPPSPPPKF